MDCMGSPTTNRLRPDLVRPCGGEIREQMMLPTAGVLKFIHQQVVDSVGKRDGRITGKTVTAPQDLLRGLRDFDEVDCTRFGKDCAQFGDRVAQKSEAGTNNAPLFVRVAN